MFKAFTNFFKSDNAKWLFVAIVLCIVAYSLLNYSNGKGTVLDAMSTGTVKPSSSLGNEVFDTNKPSNYDKPEALVLGGWQLQRQQMLLEFCQSCIHDALRDASHSEFQDLLQWIYWLFAHERC